MIKKFDIVFDLIEFIQRMREKDKLAFKNFISVHKNSEELLSLFRAFERCRVEEEPKGIVKRILIFKEGKDSRLYKRFKNLLFDFEVASKRFDYFRNEDSNMNIFFQLKKSFLAAQMLTEKDAYLTSIHIMNETYRKAEKFEFLDIQKDCAENLSSYYFLTGSIITSEYWDKESKKLNKELISYKSLHHIFEKTIQQVDCCEFHRVTNKSDSTFKHSSEMHRIKWMLEALNWKDNLAREKIDVSFQKSLSLYREITSNPGVFPRDFKVVAIKFLFEDLYRLGKFNLLTKYVENLHHLTRLPVYQRIPLMDFLLFFLLKSQNYELLSFLLQNIKSVKAYTHFQPFIDHVFKIEILYLIGQENFKMALKNLNMTNNVFKKCQYNDFDYRLLEMICLYKLKDWSVIEDKLESFRRYTFRNPNLRDSSYCLIMFNSIRSLILHNTIDSAILSVKQENNVYDLRDYLAGLVMSLAIKKDYSTVNNPILRVAESEMKIVKGRSK